MAISATSQRQNLKVAAVLWIGVALFWLFLANVLAAGV